MSSLKYRLEPVLKSPSSIRSLSVTISNDEGDWPSFVHAHSFTELFYVTAGSGDFLIEEHSYPIAKDDLIIINPSLSHTERSNPSQPLSYIAIGIEGFRFSFCGQKDYQIFNCARATENLLFYFQSILSEMSHQREGYQELCLAMLNILTILLKRITHSTLDVIAPEPSNQGCTRIKRYIDSNYQDNITLDSLASHAHLNKFYLIHAFTKTYGLSPISYLNERRIQVSKELLETTDHSIAEIAQLSGFASQSYFAQSFKKNCQMTAGAYRKKYQREKI